MVKGAKGNSEIIVISNRYKDTLDDLTDSSDAKSLDWPDQLIRGHAMRLDLKAVQQDFWKGIAWTKISQIGYYG